MSKKKTTLVLQSFQEKSTKSSKEFKRFPVVELLTCPPLLICLLTGSGSGSEMDKMDKEGGCEKKTGGLALHFLSSLPPHIPRNGQ